MLQLLQEVVKQVVSGAKLSNFLRVEFSRRLYVATIAYFKAYHVESCGRFQENEGTHRITQSLFATDNFYGYGKTILTLS